MDELEIDDALLEEVIGEVSDGGAEPPLSLQRLAELLTDRIYETDQKFREACGDQEAERKLMLSESENLNVVRKDGLFRRESFIGGEEFALQGAYASKNGKTLYWVFRPLYVCGFKVLHVDEAEVGRLMNGWKKRAEEDLADLLDQRTQLFKDEQTRLEREAINSRPEYQMNGGSW